MATYPSTGSIVDYLNAQGMDSSWSARQKLYDTSGLSKTLGGYRRTDNANQNLALLNYLQKQPEKSYPLLSVVVMQFLISPAWVYYCVVWRLTMGSG